MANFLRSLEVMLAMSTIIAVKGQSTVQVCENGDASNSIAAELSHEAIHQLNIQLQSIRQILTESNQERKSQQGTILRKLEALENDHSIIKNKTQKNYWKLEIAYGNDVGEVPVLQPIVNNWIVLMHRFDGSLDFNRGWTEYKNGFGDMRRGEFWIGNEKIHRLTTRFSYTLRIELLSISATWYYAEYSTFSIASESNNYTLRISGFSGNAGDSLTNRRLHGGFLDGMSFSTLDADNDRSSYNRAVDFEGGWWLNHGLFACLTCSYNRYFEWSTLRHLESSGNDRLRAARMMIKSK